MIALEKYIGNRIEDIKQEYLERVKDFFCKRKTYKIWKIENKKPTAIFEPDAKKELKEFIDKNFSKIICGTLPELLCLHRKAKQQMILDSDIKDYFDYEKMANKQDSIVYFLAKQLKIDVCPYCNRQYTSTVIAKSGKSIIRPQFDHFYPQSEYPLLALSFYNLIPCCRICNSLKSKTLIKLHPYIESFHDAMRFNIKNYGVDIFLTKDAEFEIKLERKKSELAEKARTNAGIFQLDKIYEEHKDYAMEIIHKAMYYNDSALKLMQDAFGHGFDEDYQKQLYYGNYLDENGIMKRPLSKLTQDIIEQFPNRKKP